MIKYKFDEEPKYAAYYANKLRDSGVLAILEAGAVRDSKEATCLSEFFWKMVDSSIEDEKSETQLPWSESAEFWNEKLMNSFSGYLESAGYEKEWDDIADKQ